MPEGSAPPPTTNEPRRAQLLSIPDFLLRLAFFLVAPIALFFVALTYPIGGALVNVAFMLTVFFTAAAIRSAAEKRPWLKRVFRKPLAFEDYYRTRPPRPFLYYVFYPLLFPYWLTQKDARREFIVFRGYTVFGLIVLVVSGCYQFFFKWRPELGFKGFFKVLVVVTLIEVAITLSMLMPIATTVVHFHLGKKHRPLGVLIVATLLMTAAMATWYAKKRHAYVAYPTSIRMVLRTKARPAKSFDVRRKALAIAYRDLRYGEGEIEHDSKIEEEILGQPIDEARDALTAFYKSDETYCFHLVSFRVKNKRILVLYGDPNDARERVVWIGMGGLGELVTDDAELPPHANAIMRRTSRK